MHRTDLFEVTVYLDSFIAFGVFDNSDEIMAIFATSIAISLPFPIAMLMTAWAKGTQKKYFLAIDWQASKTGSHFR